MEVFKNNTLSIPVKTNIKTADFLDIQFDLVKEIYQPYKKPDNDPLYINKKPQKEFQEFHQMNIFLTDQFLVTKNALKKSGYDLSQKYNPTQNQDGNNQQREQRKHNIKWFNSPNFLNVKTNLGKLFFKLLDRHSSRAHKFHKIFNRNTVKNVAAA